MDELKAIEKLAQYAQAEPSPAGSVCFSVMHRIQNTRPVKAIGLSAFAAVAAVAAMLVLAIGIYCMLNTGVVEPSAPSMQELMPNTQLGAMW